MGEYVPIPGIPADASWLRLTGNELRAFYTRSGPSTTRIYEAARDATSSPFGEGLELGGTMGSGTNASYPLPSDDGLSLRFTVDDHLAYIAYRAAVTDSFGPGTLVIDNAKDEVFARDGSLSIFSRRERFGPSPYYWFIRGQAPGTEEVRFAGTADGDAFATWYEPMSRRAWVVVNDQNKIYSWDGAWHEVGGSDFRVSWTSPNGCRLYGRYGDQLRMRSRVPSAP